MKKCAGCEELSEAVFTCQSCGSEIGKCCWDKVCAYCGGDTE